MNDFWGLIPQLDLIRKISKHCLFQQIIATFQKKKPQKNRNPFDVLE